MTPADNRLASLADAARAIAGAGDLDCLLQVVTEAAQSIVGTHQAVASRLVHGWEGAATFVSLSDKYARYRSYDEVPQGLGVLNWVTRENRPLRLTGAELAAHPEWRGLRDAPDHPPLPNYLAAPLVSRDGRNIGLVQLSDKIDGGEFTADDEALVVQLAHMASAAIEHVELRAALERTLARLTLALDATATGTWEWEPVAGEVRWSPPLERIFGFEPGAFPGTFEAYVERIHPEHREEAVAAVEAAWAGRTRLDYSYRILRAGDGAVRWVEGAGIPVYGPGGDCTGMTGVCRDVTERRESEDALRREHDLIEAIHGVGQAVTARLAVHDVVQVVTDAAVELTPASFGAFFYNVVDDAGESYQLFTISGVSRDHFDGFPMPRNTQIFEPTFRGDGTVLLDDVTADPRFGHNAPYAGLPEGHLPVRSYLAVPVVVSSGEVAGGLFFGHPDPGVFDPHDARLVEGIAGYAAIAIENARLYGAVTRELEARQRALEERSHVVSVLEQSLLPPELPDVPGLDVAVHYEGGTAEVGGDFYDLFPLRGRDWGVVIGDVCGKGVTAAAQTALSRHTLHTAAMLQRRPSGVLRVLNEAMLERDEPERFCSALFARLHPSGSDWRVDLASAGHPRPLVRRRGGAVEAVDVPGVLVGVQRAARFAEVTVALGPGDILVLYTDGVIEARHGVDTFGEDGLAAVLEGAGAASAQEVAGAVRAAVDAFRDGRSVDDIALLVLRVEPDGPHPAVTGGRG